MPLAFVELHGKCDVQHKPGATTSGATFAADDLPADTANVDTSDCAARDDAATLPTAAAAAANATEHSIPVPPYDDARSSHDAK